MPTASDEQRPDASHSESFEHLLATLSDIPAREPVVAELDVLRSIYGDEAILPWFSSSPADGRAPRSDPSVTEVVRYQVSLSLPPPHDAVSLLVLVSLPLSYPETSPPQLQLLSRYVGAFGVDSALFGSIIKTFMSVNGVEWTPGAICVFDGLENVLERVSQWYEENLESKRAGEALREHSQPQSSEGSQVDVSSAATLGISQSMQAPVLPDGIKLVEAEPIVDRKSAFVGRACRISDPEQVPAVLAYLMADRRIAKAAHPIINAWRCQVGNILFQDNDDDGETAAGGRLAHLLQILAARDALELGEFIESKRSDVGHRNKGSKR
ncbi:imprinted and ancient [Gloeopeniophorella convolvens]|nr:imprinted and ancient [Gloeopeniophorella convolvens]